MNVSRMLTILGRMLNSVNAKASWSQWRNGQNIMRWLDHKPYKDRETGQGDTLVMLNSQVAVRFAAICLERILSRFHLKKGSRYLLLQVNCPCSDAHTTGPAQSRHLHWAPYFIEK